MTTPTPSPEVEAVQEALTDYQHMLDQTRRMIRRTGSKPVETPALDECIAGAKEALAQLGAAQQERDTLRGEAQALEQLLARRPALAEFSTTYKRVAHALKTAGEVDALRAEVARLQAALAPPAPEPCYVCRGVGRVESPHPMEAWLPCPECSK